jgi:hypothetical protein
MLLAMRSTPDARVGDSAIPISAFGYLYPVTAGTHL